MLEQGIQAPSPAPDLIPAEHQLLRTYIATGTVDGGTSLSPPKTADDLHRALGQIFSKVSSGEMDERLGRSLGYIASVLVKTTELSDHEIRLRAMEEMMRSIKSVGDKR
jgi:hypothetical protein